MDLTEFVSQTLMQLVEGVRAAQKGIEQTKIVNPQIFPVPGPTVRDIAKHGAFSAGGILIQMVDFDVALTAGSETSSEGGAKVGIGVLSLGAAAKGETSSESISRISFSLPVASRRSASVTART